MTKTPANRNVGLEILEGLRQLKQRETGRVVTVPSVAAIRERTGLSQAKFAALLGVSVRTLQEWEQGRRAPSGAARTLLMVAANNPQALLEVASYQLLRLSANVVVATQISPRFQVAHSFHERFSAHRRYDTYAGPLQ